MQDTISRSSTPALRLSLHPGERVTAEPGHMAWMSGDVRMHTSTGGSGLFGALGRVMGGGTLFLTEFIAEGRGPSEVVFGAKVPGTITKVSVSARQGYLLHRHGFLCATPGVTIGTGFQRKLGAGLFGGDGFVLQKLEGEGDAWVELGGEVQVRDLAPGEVLLVHPGHVGMFDLGMTFDVQLMRGIRNIVFGADGLFLARFAGPGRIWLQTMTVPGLAHVLAPYMPSSGQ